MNYEVTLEEYGQAPVVLAFVRASDAWVQYWTWVAQQGSDGFDALRYTHNPEVIAMRLFGGDWAVTLRKVVAN